MNKSIIFLLMSLLACQVSKTNAQKLTKDDYIGTWTSVGSNEQLSIDEGMNGSKSFLQGIGYVTTLSGAWTIDDDGRIVFYPDINDVSKRDIFKVDGKYLVKDASENNTLGMYDKYSAKYIPAKEKKKNDTEKKIEDIFDIFKKK